MSSNEETLQVSSETDPVRSLEEDFHEALSAIVNGTEPKRDGAIVFKRQIERGEMPWLADTDTEKTQALTRLIDRYRNTLQTEMDRAVEARWFRNS